MTRERSEQSARRMVDKCYRNRSNVMTPNIVSYGWQGDLAWELSWGTWIGGEKMWAVSVVTADGERTDLSVGGFDTPEEAHEYIASLANEMEER